jgi:abortive infection bacteriophage resistance protein
LLKELSDDQGLTVLHEEEAIDWIRNVGYFHLKGYLSPLRVPGSKNFRPGATFESVVELFLWERELRSLLLAQIGKFELKLRAVIVNITAGVSGDGYLKDETYNPKKKEKWQSGSLEQILKRAETKGEYVFLEQFAAKNPNERIPLWILIESFSFGQAVEYFLSLASPLKEQVAREFNTEKCPGGYVTSEEFEFVLSAIKDIRNLMSHYGTFFDKSFTWLDKKPELRRSRQRFSRTNSEYLPPSGEPLRTFDVINLLLMFQPSFQKDSDRWKQNMKELLMRFPQAPGIRPSVIGVPSDWSSTMLWGESGVLDSQSSLAYEAKIEDDDLVRIKDSEKKKSQEKRARSRKRKKK